LVPALFVVGASDSTISGWANTVHAVYSDIGGCFSFMTFVVFFVLILLMLFLVSDRLEGKLRSVDYFRLLRMNLEPQSIVCLLIFLAVCCLVWQFLDLCSCRVIIWRWLLRSIALMRFWTETRLLRL
jgi:hypothetical protein